MNKPSYFSHPLWGWRFYTTYMNKDMYTVFGSAPGEPNYVLAIHETREGAEVHANELRESAKLCKLDEVYYSVIPSQYYNG